MTLPRNPRAHFILPPSITTTSAYQAPNGGGRDAVIPEQPRGTHAQHLRAELSSVARQFEGIKQQQEAAGWDRGFGLTIRFTSFPDVQLAIDSLEQKQAGIELLSVHESGNEMFASVWVPEGKLEVFERKIADYLGMARDRRDRPRDSRKFLDAIRDIRTAVIEDLWVDDAPLPPDNTVACFEAWISTPRESPVRGRQFQTLVPDERIERFRRFAELAGMLVSTQVLRFPERAVLQLRGTIAQLRTSSHLLGQLAELRRAPDTAAFFMELVPSEQREWADDLLSRAQFQASGALVPYICVLDTGCSQGHPLVSQALHTNDLHTVDPTWGTADDHGHGTAQSGLAIWGDLTNALASQGHIQINHRLESVKLLPRDHANLREHFGPLTAQAVSIPEIVAPSRHRLFSMAVTSTDTTLRGRPTAWSAEVDALTSDWAGDGENPRLMVLSAGNVSQHMPGSYAELNSNTSVEDPAQSWNALTVGAITHKTSIVGNNTRAYSPLAQTGCLSPYSSTSFQWSYEAPFKPDVVFEGGNMGADGTLVSGFDSLSLLTTHHRPTERLLSTSFATSAATGLASRFAAQIMGQYPALWPETVRALIVHSADWTPGLLTQYPGMTPQDTVTRLRHCGWGEPDLDLALHSGADSLTLVVQGALQPFQRRPVVRTGGKRSGGNITARDMHLHRLPWPRDVLSGLLSQDVELRVTLSYFVEPSPGERGRSSKFSYPSHGLRFAVQKPTETSEAFRRRVNVLARDAEEGIAPSAPTSGSDSGWLLGFRKRFRGSLHHDRLTCSAVDLASREHIAVFPVGGWWKTREAQERFDREARYALVVSIHAPLLPLDIDLYTSVEQMLRTDVAVEIAQQV